MSFSGMVLLTFVVRLAFQIPFEVTRDRFFDLKAQFVSFNWYWPFIVVTQLFLLAASLAIAYLVVGALRFLTRDTASLGGRFHTSLAIGVCLVIGATVGVMVLLNKV
jgi:hypothetical protein